MPSLEKVPLLVGLLFTTAAHAERGFERVIDAREPGPMANDYADHLFEMVGRKLGATDRQVAYVTWKGEGEIGSVRGLQVKTGDLTVERVFFEDENAAIRFLNRVDLHDRQVRLFERRGREVVIAQSSEMFQQDEAWRLEEDEAADSAPENDDLLTLDEVLRAAWGVLPRPPGPSYGPSQLGVAPYYEAKSERQHTDSTDSGPRLGIADLLRRSAPAPPTRSGE